MQLATLQTAAPAMYGVLDRLASESSGGKPTPAWYVRLARVLAAQQSARLGADGSTSHLSVVDAEGGVVSLTTTLLSAFGSRVVLPQSGVLMNNGVMWFDPMRGRSNSLRPRRAAADQHVPRAGARGRGRRGCAHAGRRRVGGRRILSAVAQVLAYATEFGMDPTTAMAMPRIDVGGSPRVTADHRLPPDVLQALAADGLVDVVEPTLSPGLFGAASLLAVDGEGVWSGASDPSPWSAALAVGG